VGAGISGATAARLLAEAGVRATVLETRSHLAGNCHDCLNEEGLFIQPHGPHIFHTSDDSVWNFLGRFTGWLPYEHRVLANVGGKLLPFPINLDTIGQLMGKSFSPEEMAEFLKSEVSRSTYGNPPANFRDQVVSQVGERLYEAFFKHYTEKQWGRAPEELSAEVAKRIPLRLNHDDRYFTDPFQGIPQEGFTEMISRMLDHPQIEVCLNCDFFDERPTRGTALTVFTGEVDRFFGYKHGKLEYRSLMMDFRTLDERRHQPAAVVNFPGTEPWTRITEFKHLYSQESPKTTLCYEYPAAEGHPYYVVYTERNLANRARYMEEIEALELAGSHIFCGRLAEYRYYNMDQAVASAISKVEAWLNRRRA
jgi:UDP-galactopyranose mutase